MLNIVSLRNYKLKRKHDTTTHLLEWETSRILRTPKASEDVKRQERSLTAGSNAKWQSHFERQSASFLQFNIVIPYDPALMLLIYLLK